MERQLLIEKIDAINNLLTSMYDTIQFLQGNDRTYKINEMDKLRKEKVLLESKLNNNVAPASEDVPEITTEESVEITTTSSEDSEGNEIIKTTKKPAKKAATKKK